MNLSEEQLRENIACVREKIEQAARRAGRRPDEILLCAASKMQDADTVRRSATMGIDLFGENRVQELVQKRAEGAYGDRPLHFIGHLQTNKVRQVVGAAVMIQSVGSLHLLEAVEKEAARQDLCQDILLEVNVGGEASKSGIAPEGLPGLAEAAAAMPHVHVRGLMAIPPIRDSERENRRDLAAMKKLFDDLRDRGIQHVEMEFLSMGMSGDFENAILEGATIVRVGTAIYGARNQ